MKVSIKFDAISSPGYEVFIDEMRELEFDTKVAIITNETIAKLHLEGFKKRVRAKELYEVIIKDGEQYKNLNTIEYILSELFKFKLDRKSLLIAFGGGVVGDMSGFAASIYQRGIDFVQVPTTLLAQVDASVGGKTGVNNSFGKNLIGSFHQPRAVYCESEFLKTLNAREFSAGVAEIIKIAVMFDKSFYSWLESAELSRAGDLREAILKSVRIKAKVVAQDEKEAGVRAVLNYGHTFAHIIENETNYSKYLHGEAVAFGMVMANELAVKLGLLSRAEADNIENTLKRFSLPTRYKIQDIERFYEAFFLDKKSSNSKITFILPHNIGGYAIKDDIDEKSIKEILRIFS
ncbi:MAG: 3-dehydroquinate synthase [Campylobacteraceae bacterium]|jgi:3-dehydroquinate synthase|nr:3-dehydroquinate synthase [Campylobacteraceae bacterium]